MNKKLIQQLKDGEGESLPRVSVKDFFKDKEIIGYKLVKPEYKDAAIKIAGFPPHFIEDSRKIKPNTGGGTLMYQKLKKAGVLDLWFEPVYEVEVKLPTIDGYEGKIEGDELRYGCASLSKEWFNNSSNRHIKSMVLSSGVVINEEQMEQIRKYLKEN